MNTSSNNSSPTIIIVNEIFNSFVSISKPYMLCLLDLPFMRIVKKRNGECSQQRIYTYILYCATVVNATPITVYQIGT